MKPTVYWLKYEIDYDKNKFDQEYILFVTTITANDQSHNFLAEQLLYKLFTITKILDIDM